MVVVVVGALEGVEGRDWGHSAVAEGAPEERDVINSFIF